MRLWVWLLRQHLPADLGVGRSMSRPMLAFIMQSMSYWIKEWNLTDILRKQVETMATIRQLNHPFPLLSETERSEVRSSSERRI